MQLSRFFRLMAAHMLKVGKYTGGLFDPSVIGPVDTRPCCVWGAMAVVREACGDEEDELRRPDSRLGAVLCQELGIYNHVGFGVARWSDEHTLPEVVKGLTDVASRLAANGL